tara:strand:- start:751 stop:1908 length:1158 start_codon:yes stop_codon:yes gene_type:complete
MSFELDISKYNNDELRNIFNLNVNYTLQDIQLNKNFLKNKLINDNSLTSDKRDKIIQFLNNAQTRLVHNILDLNKRPESEQKKYELLCIDTKYRKDYYNTSSTNFLYNLPFDLNNVLGITLSEITIPCSIWTINEKYLNNYFWIQRDSSWNFIRIQNGNYQSNNDIIKEINKSIKLTSGAHGGDTDLSGIYYSINNLSNQSVFGSSSDISFNVYFNRESLSLDELNIATDASFSNYITTKEPKVLTRNLMQGLGWMLGFRYGEYINQTDLSNNVYVSEGIYDNWNPKNIFLIIDDFANNSNNAVISTFSDSIGSSNILARLQTNRIFNTKLTTSNPEVFNYIKRTYNSPVNIKKMQIKLVDDFGRQIELNNMDYSLSIIVESLYK